MRLAGRLKGAARLAPILIPGLLDRVGQAWFLYRNPAEPAASEHAAQRAVESYVRTMAASHEGFAATLEARIAAGIAFLARTQRRDGLWRGFMLEPGASTEWISAHVAFVLEQTTTADAICERAARALRDRRAGRRGWGYNGRVRIDSDSTAQALSVLQRYGHSIAPEWIEELLATRREDGGFATYATTRADGRARTWWEMPHADVTVLVAATLKRLDRDRDGQQRAREWLLTQSVGGVLPAYWWTSPAYPLWAQARSGFEPAATSHAAHERLDDEHRPVHLAMLLGATLSRSEWSARVASGLMRLTAAQLTDGSWQCDPCLRHTRADHAGGFDAPGPVYADRYRAFSTAHAVAALNLGLDALRKARATGQPLPG